MRTLKLVLSAVLVVVAGLAVIVGIGGDFGPVELVAFALFAVALLVAALLLRRRAI